MSAMQDALRLVWSPGINAISGRQSAGLQEWISKERYFVDNTSNVNVIRLENVSLTEFNKSLAFDVSRFASASFETLASIYEVPELPRTGAWAAIKLYYAAFYAAHTLIRCWGSSVSQIDIQNIVKLRRVARICGHTEAECFKPGLYIVRNNPFDSSVNLTRNDGDGSHERLWLHFGLRIDELIIRLQDSNILEEDRITIGSALKKLMLILRKRGLNGSNWLSMFRNEVTYRQSYGLWYPHRTDFSLSKFKELVNGNLEKEALAIPLENTSDISDFVNAATFICNLCQNTLADMWKRCPQGKSFLDSGYMSLIRQTGSYRRPHAA